VDFGFFFQKILNRTLFFPKDENWHDFKIGKNTKMAKMVNLFSFIDHEKTSANARGTV